MFIGGKLSNEKAISFLLQFGYSVKIDSSVIKDSKKKKSKEEYTTYYSFHYIHMCNEIC